MSKGLKFFLIFLIIVVFGAIAYFLLSEGDIPSLSLGTQSPSLQTSSGEAVSVLDTSSSAQIDADQIGQEFLTQLLNIRSIKLRDDVLSSPAFTSLIDFTIELVQLGNEGRPNPFAPFGVDDPSSLNIPTDTESFPMESADTNQPQEGGEFFGPGNVTPVTPVIDSGVMNS